MRAIQVVRTRVRQGLFPNTTPLFVGLSVTLGMLAACGEAEPSPGGGTTNGGTMSTAAGTTGQVTAGATATGGTPPVGVAGTGGSAAVAGSVGVGGTPPISTGGTTATGGTGTAGTAPTGGTPGAGGTAPATVCITPTWPASSGSKTISSTQTVDDLYDGAMALHNGSGGDLDIDCSGGNEQDSVEPLFELEDGATIKNVVFGKYAADGIHCKGSCNIENVWWEDLCDDGATFLGSSSSVRVNITGGGARHGADKTFQHNGGGTVIIKNFYVEDVGKLYRSCGDCNTTQRHVEITDVFALNVHTQLVGVNKDNGDTAKIFPKICVKTGTVNGLCGIYVDNDHQSSGADGTTCIYKSSDVKNY